MFHSHAISANQLTLPHTNSLYFLNNLGAFLYFSLRLASPCSVSSAFPIVFIYGIITYPESPFKSLPPLRRIILLIFFLCSPIYSSHKHFQRVDKQVCPRPLLVALTIASLIRRYL